MQALKRFWQLSAGLILMAAFLAPAAQAQQEAAPNSLGPLGGSVVDPAGEPAAGATVWLLSGSMTMETQVVAQTTADRKGEFHFGAVRWNRQSPYDSPPLLVAEDARGRIGTSGISTRSPGNLLPRNSRITLLDGKDYSGRLLDDAGRPIARAAVKPTLWVEDRQDPWGMYQVLMLPPKLQEELSTQSGADGRFTLRGFPASGTIYAQLRTADFGAPLAKWKLEKPVSVRLARPGSLQGSITCAKDAHAAAGIKCTLVGNEESGPSHDEETDFSIHYFESGTTQADGTFHFDKLPPGKYTLQPELPADLPFSVEAMPTAEVKSGQAARLAIRLTPAVKVEGKAIDQETRKGVAGVHLMLFPNGDAAVRRDAVTGADGTFTLYSKPGRAFIYVWQVPDRYVAPSPYEMGNVEIAEKTTIPPIALDRAVNVELAVVDAAGKPVPNAEVRYVDAQTQWAANQEVLRTDAEGKAALGRYSPKDTLKVRARTAGAAAGPKAVALRGLRQPVRLELSPTAGVGLLGKLIDDAGNPIPQAKISLMAEIDPGRDSEPNGDDRWYGGVSPICLEQCQSDAKGGFSFGGLWPDAKYVVLVKVPGHERYASARIEAAAGVYRSLGEIVLPRTSAPVAGRIVDSTGRRVEGARVFNSGDGPEPMETTSGAAGEFRLEGFRKGPVCVFAVKQGYRFAGLRTAAGTAGVELKMLRSDESPATSRVESTPLNYEEQKKLARQLLEKLWAAATKGDKPGGGGLLKRAGGILRQILGPDKNSEWKQSLIASMAKIDPEQSRKWAATIPAEKPEGAEKESIEQTADADLDEALSMLEKAPEGACRQLQSLAGHFAPSDKEKALRCAEEAIVRVRGLDQPERALQLAFWGGMVVELGNKDAGKKLIAEAAEMTDRWKPSDRNRRALGQIAVALAPHDSGRAVRLLGKIADKSERQGYQVQVAVATGDLGRAEPLLKELDAEAAHRARLSLAYRIAPKKPAEALRLLEKNLAEHRPEDSAAGQLGQLAELIETHDAALACLLVDRVFAIYLPAAKPSKASRAWNEAAGDHSGQAARLAVLARKVGHADMEGVILRALALRPTPDKDDSPVPAMELTVQMAKVLAMADPAAAKRMLETIEWNSEALSDRAEWFQAWALADPQRAMELAQRELAAAEKGQGKPAALEAVRAMAEIWATPPDQRMEPYGQRFGVESRLIEQELPMP